MQIEKITSRKIAQKYARNLHAKGKNVEEISKALEEHGVVSKKTKARLTTGGVYTLLKLNSRRRRRNFEMPGTTPQVQKVAKSTKSDELVNVIRQLCNTSNLSNKDRVMAISLLVNSELTQYHS